MMDDARKFTAWLHRETCTFPKLRFGVVPGFQGVSGIATAAIGPGETVAALAPRLLLTSSAAHAQIPELRAALAASSEPRLSRAAADRAAVWCLLIHERALKERSLWAPYIAILPTSATDHTVPTFHHAASDDVSAALAGTRMLEAVRRRLRVLDDVYRCVVEPLLAADPSGKRFDPATWSRSALAWAAQSFWSRAIRVPMRGLDNLSAEVEAMVPLVDMLNHRPGALSELSCASAAASTVRLTDGVGFAAGAQVTINYGPRSQGDLLLNFGFVLPPPNAADVVIVDERELRSALRSAGGGGGEEAAALPLVDTHLVAAEAGEKREKDDEPARKRRRRKRDGRESHQLTLHVPLSAALLDRVRAIAVDVTGCPAAAAAAAASTPQHADAGVSDFEKWVAAFRQETEDESGSGGGGGGGSASSSSGSAGAGAGAAAPKGTSLAPKDERHALNALRRVLAAMLKRNSRSSGSGRESESSSSGGGAAAAVAAMIATYTHGQVALLRSALDELDRF